MSGTPAASGGEEPGLTHRDIAAALGITVTTVKSYRRKFPEFFAGASGTRPIRFPAQAGEVCARIQALFERGYPVEKVRERLSLEFPAQEAQPAPPGSSVKHAAAPDPLARIEGLLEGLFSIQNRTHSLLADLLARLDTVADALAAQPQAGPPALGRPESKPAPKLAPVPAPVPATKPGAAEPAALRPPAELLALPVVVLSADGEYLGVSNRGGKAFSLAQFEEFLITRAKGLGPVVPLWRVAGQEWVLGLRSGGQAHEHHFIRAVTPKGNAVARFSALSVGGRAESDAALQAFLRQVKESLAQ
ncbi:MAG: MerR family transcriptional regulator [Acidobacteriota bacterium]